MGALLFRILVTILQPVLRNRGYLGFTSTSAITGFQWDTTGGGITNTGFSNLSVGSATSTVPEPSTWTMLLIAFAGLGLARWRSLRVIAG